MANNYLYSFEDTSVILGGVSIIDFDDGDDVIQIQYNSNLFNTTIGADRGSVDTPILDDSATITLRLLQTSVSNDFLSSILVGYRTGTYTPLPLLVNNSRGNDKFFAANVRILTRPAATYGKTQNAREWVLYAAQLESFFGGSSPS